MIFVFDPKMFQRVCPVQPSSSCLTQPYADTHARKDVAGRDTKPPQIAHEREARHEPRGGERGGNAHQGRQDVVVPGAVLCAVVATANPILHMLSRAIVGCGIHLLILSNEP